MKTHTELLTELIEAVYALPISPSIKEVHDLQMKAAEIRGQMLATNPLQNETPSNQSDDDGWIENTGVMPECEISAYRYFDGEVVVTCDKSRGWDALTANNKSFVITHYRPA